MEAAASVVYHSAAESESIEMDCEGLNIKQAFHVENVSEGHHWQIDI